MTPKAWWEPGAPAGWVSRRWAPVFVFPVPALNDEELQTSLKYRVSALLPSPEKRLTVNRLRVRGKDYGVVIVDRRPPSSPLPKGLWLATPVVLPRSLPGDCRLAVLTPEGWEFSDYEEGVLVTSYPPARDKSQALIRLVAERQRPIFWWNPVPDAPNLAAPDWAQPVPQASRVRGYRWLGSPGRAWMRVFIGGIFLLAAIVASGSLSQQINLRESRNQDWAESLRTIRDQVFAVNLTGGSEITLDTGEPLREIMRTLDSAWPTGVTIEKLTVNGGRVQLTGKAVSALEATSRLKHFSLWQNVNVLSVRSIDGGELFELEGGLSFDP